MSDTFTVGCISHGVGSIQSFTVSETSPFDQWSKPGTIWDMGLFNFGLTICQDNKHNRNHTKEQEV